MPPVGGGSRFDGGSDLDPFLSCSPAPSPMAEVGHPEGFPSHVLYNPGALQVTDREEKERGHEETRFSLVGSRISSMFCMRRCSSRALFGS